MRHRGSIALWVCGLASVTWVAAAAQEAPPIRPADGMGFGDQLTGTPAAAFDSARTLEPQSVLSEPIAGGAAASREPISAAEAALTERLDELIAALRGPPLGDAADVRALTLRELVEPLGTRERSQAVRAYWSLFEQAVRVQIAVQEEAQLSALGGVAESAEEGSLRETARRLAVGRRCHAEADRLAVQLNLREFLAWDETDRPIVPADAPWIGPYETRYELIAARYPIARRWRSIDAELAQRRAAVRAAGEAALAGAASADASLAAAAAGRTTAPRRWRASASAGKLANSFCAVTVYNQTISDYAFAVAPQGMEAEDAVAMLIKPSRFPHGAERNPSLTADPWVAGASYREPAETAAITDDAVRPMTASIRGVVEPAGDPPSAVPTPPQASLDTPPPSLSPWREGGDLRSAAPPEVPPIRRIAR